MVMQKTEERKKKEKKYRIKQIFIILIVLIGSITLVTSLGRYVLNSINDFFLRTKEFYFYSDKLSTSAYYQIDNWTGVDDYTITINMNSRLNNLKVTSYDINYNISYTCSSNITCQLSKTTGTITSATNTDYFNLILSPNTTLSVGDSVWVTIQATSTTGYTKTLQATFVLRVGKESVSYEIVDSESSKYLDLNITNTLSYYKVKEAFDTYSVGDKIDVDTYVGLSDINKSKCSSATITISFDPNVVILDMTNSNYLNATNVTTTTIDGTTYINGMTFNVEPISSTVVRFYKKDVTQNYTYPITNTTSIITLSSS